MWEDVQQVNALLENIEGMAEDELYEFACKKDELMDWEKVRQRASDVSQCRSVEDLRRHWDHNLRPDVTRSSWTRDENKQLNLLVEAAQCDDGVDWHAIARDLGNFLFNYSFQSLKLELMPIIAV